jgi:hypothetical protein
MATLTYTEDTVPKYVIERDLPGAGKLSADELTAISKKSNEILAGMADRAQWQESYVTDDKLFCVYVADDSETIREHANGGGFPVTAIHRVSTVIDPTTGLR